VVVGFIASLLGNTEMLGFGLLLAGFIILLADSEYNKVKNSLSRLRTQYKKTV